MSFCKKVSITVTADGSGNASSQTDYLNGIVNRITYTKNNYANGVDVTVTTDDGVGLWAGTDVNASTTVYPELGTVGDKRKLALADQKVTFALAQAGAGTIGTFTIYLE